MSLPETFVKGFHNEESIKKMQYNKLGATGLNISKISIGGCPYSVIYGEYTEDEGIATIIEAFKQGINYIDTAPYYGEGTSEIVIGKALKNVPREAYYISTKVGRYTTKWETAFDYSKETIKSRFETSLKRLGLTYTDIVVIHDVEFGDINQILNEALPAVQELKNEGKARNIAISGYPVATLADIISKSKVKIDAVLTYCRDTLIDSTLKKFIPEFKKKNIGIISATPTAMAMLTNEGPRPWHPASNEIKEKCAKAANYCKEQGLEIGTLSVHHTLSNPDVHTCLIGMKNRTILKYNLDLLHNGLTQKQNEVLQVLLSKYLNPADNLQWEGVEINAYKTHLASLK